MNKKLFYEGLNNYLLTEGRKSNVAKKYPYLAIPNDSTGGDSVLKMFLDNDPSGNHKYLEWMATTYNNQFLQPYRQGLMGLHPSVPFGGSRPSIDKLDAAYLKMALSAFQQDSRDVGVSDEDSATNVRINMAYVKDSMARLKVAIMERALKDTVRGTNWELFDYYETWADNLDYKFMGVTLRVPSSAIIIDLAKTFHRLLPYVKNKDINSYVKTDTLYAALVVANSKLQAKVAQKDLKDAAKSGARIIFEQGKVSVIRPETEKASCLFGKGTQWCISAEKSQNYFNNYTKRGKSFYFFFFPNHPQNHVRSVLEKVALVLNPDGSVDSVFDSNDRLISLDLLKHAWNRYSSSNLAEAEEDSNTLPDFEEVLSKVKIDTLRHPVEQFGLRVSQARDILQNEFSELHHEFTLENKTDPIEKVDYIEIEPMWRVEIPLSNKLRAKLDNWEEQYDNSTGNATDDLIGMIDGSYNPNPREHEYKNYIQGNIVKLLTGWLKENWPDGVGIRAVDHGAVIPGGHTEHPKYKIEDVSVTGDRTSENRGINVYLIPQVDYNHTFHADSESLWRTYLKSLVELEKLIEEMVGSFNAQESLKYEFQDLLSKAGIAPELVIHDPRQTEMDFPKYKRPSRSGKYDNSLEESVKKWKRLFK
tara:strand:+ start:591 stop:2528 length:1938 start_codon:yes stop_codon:yes gene_type:complete